LSSRKTAASASNRWNSGLLIGLASLSVVLQNLSTRALRLAIIDHGKILVCDSPKSLKSTLGADSIVDVTLKHSQPERAAKIRELPGVSGVDCTAKGYRVHSRALDGLLPKILEVTGTGHLYEIAVIEPSLETVFITLTGREMGE
jgi:ABC-2 type transport system ATP-binding protein